jgi:hypothetical protein
MDALEKKTSREDFERKKAQLENRLRLLQGTNVGASRGKAAETAHDSTEKCFSIKSETPRRRPSTASLRIKLK